MSEACLDLWESFCSEVFSYPIFKPSRFASIRAGYFFPTVFLQSDSTDSIGIKGQALAIAPSMTMLMRDLDFMAIESASRQYSVPMEILYFSAASSHDKGVFRTIFVSAEIPSNTG